MNKLANEKSPYLRHAAEQKIAWYPWSDEAFARARQEDKPVFLSSGAVWCHWCHVMARESFEDPETADLLNTYYICIKIDRDERPDIDRRYQQAVAAMGYGGGWPLSVFLTPERKPFFGGTYFPPADIQGRPGFKKVLAKVAEYYSAHRTEVASYGEKLMDILKPQHDREDKITGLMADAAVEEILSAYDDRNGGFGFSPKFPMPGALSLLTNRFFLTRKEAYGDSVRKTLTAMAKGGIHDQIGGGFHRYSVDEAWIVPHFEKMADDNAWHLRNYTDAYALFGDEYFRQVAEGIIRFLRDVLSDPDGGFYASQDADAGPEDEGGYFTWTEDEFRQTLHDDEYEILSLHLMDERGAMHHDRSRKVLFVASDMQEIIRRTGKDAKTIQSVIRTGKGKLLAAREKRETPFVDSTFYTSLNGMLVTSCLKASRVLDDADIREFALLSLRRILKAHWAGGELFHTEGVKAVLDDYIYLTEALIAAYEVSGEPSYLNLADTCMDTCIGKFWDTENGGFFDTETEVIGVRLKSVEDIPHPSANGVGILLLLKLYSMTGKVLYRAHAETAVKVFSSAAQAAPLHAAYYFCALEAFFLMMKLTIQAAPDSQLARTAFASFIPYLSVVYEDEKGIVIPCIDTVCYEPIRDPDVLKKFLREAYALREPLFSL
ncbi:MAG: thioredoxin domain-containing protein [Nitrospirota bacterium]